MHWAIWLFPGGEMSFMSMIVWRKLFKTLQSSIAFIGIPCISLGTSPVKPQPVGHYAPPREYLGLDKKCFLSPVTFLRPQLVWWLCIQFKFLIVNNIYQKTKANNELILLTRSIKTRTSRFQTSSHPEAVRLPKTTNIRSTAGHSAGSIIMQ